MPLPVVAGSFLVRLVWLNGSVQRPATNDMCFHDDAGGHTGTDIYNAIDSHVTHDMWKTTSGDGVVDHVITTKLDGTAASVIHPTGTPAKWQGGEASQTIPQGCCVATIRTGFRGRSRRGRIFIPWIGEGAQDSGTLDGTKVAAQQAAWTTFFAAMLADGFPIHVLSKLHTDSVEATEVQIQSFLKTQRRRSRR